MVVFQPTAVGAANGTATITANVVVAGSPVTLKGTGAAASATLTPTSNDYGSHIRNCPSPVLACGADPIQAHTLSNTGNVTLTGITQAFSAERMPRTSLSTGSSQPAARPVTAAPESDDTGSRSAMLDNGAVQTSHGGSGRHKDGDDLCHPAAGTQSSALTGTAQ